MKTKNSGNVKLVSLLFLLGSSSAVLLIPAVIQKESPYSEYGIVKGNSEQNSLLAFNQVADTVEKFKEDFIEKPINKVSETTDQVTSFVQNPEKLLTKEFTEVDNPGSEQQNVALDEKKNYSSVHEPMVRITKEMVDNCKVITDEYNKSGN